MCHRLKSNTNNKNNKKLRAPKQHVRCSYCTAGDELKFDAVNVHFSVRAVHFHGDEFALAEVYLCVH